MWGQQWGSMTWGTQTIAAVPALPGGMLLLLGALLLLVGYRMGRRQRAPRWMALVVGLGVALVPLAIVHATSTFGVPFTFTNGTVADASQMNQNFTAVANEINNLRNQTSVVTECEFRARTSTQAVHCGTGGGGAYLSAAGIDGTLVAAVHVPSGAIITSADVWVGDTNPSTDIQVCMTGLNDNFGAFDSITFSCASTTGSPGIVKLTITTNVTVVQGNNKSFELNIFSNDTSGFGTSWPTDGSITVRSAYVHYQLPYP
jgi:hypothetical protein